METLHKGNKMTPEQQQTAIAEACGWKHHHTRPSETERHQKKWRYLSDLPNYLNDLNAMHEAEKVLTKEQRRKYVRTLFQTTNTDWDSHCATAAQRARAFLKTLGVWEETK